MIIVHNARIVAAWGRMYSWHNPYTVMNSTFSENVVNGNHCSFEANVIFFTDELLTAQMGW